MWIEGFGLEVRSPDRFGRTKGQKRSLTASYVNILVLCCGRELWQICWKRKAPLCDEVNIVDEKACNMAAAYSWNE